MRPRMVGGDTSDMYMGDSSETAPTARPPAKRAAMKRWKVGARAVAIEVNANKTATHDMMALRP